MTGIVLQTSLFHYFFYTFVYLYWQLQFVTPLNKNMLMMTMVTHLSK